jgi:anti-sigma regulatory factor (Ser/Thr protein kinase)
MGESVRILVEEASKTAEARRYARAMAANIGLNETVAEQVSIVVTEACTNLLKHAGRGEIILHSSSEGLETTPLLDVLALDQGPGMRNLQQSLQDGYSTGSTAGHGLGAIIRLSQDSDFYTVPQKGTGILARWWTEPSKPSTPSLATLRISAVNLPKPGQEVSGDAWGAVHFADYVLVLLADGLGHGLEANIASMEAVRILRLHPDLPPAALLQRVHSALRGTTRGAAVAVARIDLAHNRVTFAGVGNISARIYSGAEPRHSLVSGNGTAGHQTERIQEFSYPWPANGLLQLHSDGLATGAGLEPYPGLFLRDPALIAGVLYRDFARGRDDSTVVVAKAS